MGKAEAAVEVYLDAKVKELGGFTRKFAYIGRRGGADRIVFLFGSIMLVECKTTDGVESVLQRRERRKIRATGARAHIVYGKEGVDKWIQDITTWSGTAKTLKNADFAQDMSGLNTTESVGSITPGSGFW